ncbi:methyl-accepting chemotaxis protein [Candidatus Magnetomorum sp. HK-1]|nr:methyl-accepting chemotaxis protein [Candidatus Magnetomorum sp. HK-1]
MSFQKIGLKTKMMLGSCAPLILVVLLGVACMWSIKLLLETSAKVDHSHRIMGSAQEIEKLIGDLEIGERGFLIAGKDEFLTPYLKGKKDLSSKIGQSKQMVEQDESQVKRLAQIESLISQWYEKAATPEIAERRKVEEGLKSEEYLKDVLAEGIGKEKLVELKTTLENMEIDFLNSENMAANNLVLALSKDIADMKNGVRGFLITGKDEFLYPYTTGHDALQRHLKFIRQNVDATYDREIMAENVGKIEELVSTWQEEVGEALVALREQFNEEEIDFEEMIETYLENSGTEILDELSQAIEAVLADFDKEMNERALRLLAGITKSMAEMQMGVRGFLLSGEEDSLIPYQTAKDNVGNQLMDLSDLVQNAYDLEFMKENIDKVEDLSSTWSKEDAEPKIEYRVEMNKKMATMSDVTALIQAGTGKKFMDAVRKELENFTLRERTIMKARQDLAKTTANSTKTLIILGTLMTLFVALVISYILTRSITRPFKEIFQGLEAFSLLELHDVQSQFGHITESLTESGQLVNEASVEIAEGANVQAASLQETAASMEEISSMTRMNNTNANQANELMQEANLLVQRTNKAMDELALSMNAISEASDKTVKIIKSIDEIAFQTNILSLNASIEAARAGEQGAGFAVVAGEVRDLAKRSAEAANSTATLIEGNVSKIQKGSELVGKAEEAFSEVANIASKVAKLVSEIAAASDEQTQGIVQINKSLTEMEDVTQQNASSTQNLSEQAGRLNAQVNIMLSILEGSDDEDDEENENSEDGEYEENEYYENENDYEEDYEEEDYEDRDDDSDTQIDIESYEEFIDEGELDF